MLYVLLIVVWLTDGTQQVNANAYPTQIACIQAAYDAKALMVQNQPKDVTSAIAQCIPAVNPASGTPI